MLTGGVRTLFQSTAGCHAGRHARRPSGHPPCKRFNPRPAVTPAATSTYATSSSTLSPFQSTAGCHAGRHSISRAIPASLTKFQSTAGCHAGRHDRTRTHPRGLPGFNPRPAVTPAATKPAHEMTRDEWEFQSTAGCHAGRHIEYQSTRRTERAFQSTAGCHAGRHKLRIRLSTALSTGFNPRPAVTPAATLFSHPLDRMS